LYALTQIVKHERRPVEGDQVDLAVAGAGVAGEDHEAEPLKVCGRQLLAEASQRVAGVLGWRGRVRGGIVPRASVLLGSTCGGLLGWRRRGEAHNGKATPGNVP